LGACETASARLDGTAGQALREPTGVTDLDPDPRFLEFNLSAAAMQYEFLSGLPSTVLAYNGQIPGPTIEATAGDEIVVHFRNNLDQPTTIHWHGIRLTPEMDGGPLSQEPVPPGGSFEYRFTVPDPGLYWYHPHHLEEEQIQSGLYGALLVRATNEPQFTRERILVLSDVMLDDAGMLLKMDHSSIDHFTNALGMEGNTQLVNGQVLPRIELAPGGRERWRVLNAAGARYFNLAVPGHSMTLIGVDGGLIEAPLPVQSLLLSPGERADLVIDNGGSKTEPGELKNLSYKRIDNEEFVAEPDSVLARLSYSSKAAVETPQIPDQLADIPQLQPSGTKRFFQLTAKVPEDSHAAPMTHTHGAAMEAGDGMDMGGDGVPGTSFEINHAAWPDVPPFEVLLGETEIWEINNHTEMDHPFHIHGFQFQVLDLDGEPWPYRGWKDTVNIPGGGLGDKTIRLAVRYQGFPGQWLYHCHILHHNSMGMMAHFVVQE